MILLFVFLESIIFVVSKILSNYEFSVKLLLDRDEAVLFLTLRTTKISFCSLFVLLCFFFYPGENDEEVSHQKSSDPTVHGN